MAVEVGAPGCLYCLFRSSPAIQIDALCEHCLRDLQNILGFEECAAEGVVGDDGDSENEVVGAGGDEILFAGTPTTCPPTSDTDMDFAEAGSPDS